MTKQPFRARLFAMLLAFALVPAVALTGGLVAGTGALLPLLGGAAAWDSVAASGQGAFDALRDAPLSPAQRGALERHEQELSASATQARRVRFLAERASAGLIVAGALLVALLAYLASRVAGHLSRQLSRPVDELADWARRIGRGDPLPEGPEARGAPEFGLLRAAMRRMSAELDASKTRDLEAARLRAFRDSARQVAHELKNPLTPIRLAIARLERQAPADAADALEVLQTETRRLDGLARAFAQFGRLPEGPTSPVDVGELVQYTTRATIADTVPVTVAIAPGVPPVEGQYEALSRALSNLLLNAADAVRDRPDAQIRVTADADAARVRVRVIDNGPGVSPDQLPQIWEPYVTGKPGGTGLGLAIVRQTIEAHGGTTVAMPAPGGGLAIGFDLPAAATSPRSAP